MAAVATAAAAADTPGAAGATGEAGEAGAAGRRKCVYVIFNPVSGKSDPEERQAAISGALARHGYACQFVSTTEERGADALAREALGEGVDLVAVSGGDGTVMAALSALVGTGVPVAVLPAGTGNLLSANLGIPTTVPDAVEVALSGSPYELDLARTGDGRYFAIMGGVGLDAQVIGEADRASKDRLGVLAYFLAGARNLSRPRASVRVSLDGRPPLRRRAKTVLIANMGGMGAGLDALPTASPQDGLLDIGIVRTLTPWQWLRLGAYVLLGRAQDDPAMEAHQARRVRVQTRARSPQPVQFDGEEGGRTSDLSVEVVPRAVRVLLPEGAPAARGGGAQRPGESPADAARRAAERRLAAVGTAALLACGAGVAAALWLRRRGRGARGRSAADDAGAGPEAGTL
jgi:YegS/Rv2252/BmrU family lipid kinase